MHRLDKDTTGAIAIAKTDIAHQHLQAQLKTKTARREYLGVVYGVPNTETGTIDLPIGRHPTDRKKMAVVPEEKGGRPSVTHWTIKERIGNYCLIHYQFKTGHPSNSRPHSRNQTSYYRRPDVQFQPFHRRKFNRTSPARLEVAIATSFNWRVD